MDMTAHGLDLSFLQDEEASRILEVLDRDEEVRRTERDRLSKLGTSKRDVKWLHAVSGEWFEEIQKKKFRDDPDVRNLVRPPLTHRLKKKTPKGDLESSRMSSSRTYQSPKSSNSGPSFLKIRSPFASLFSFRKAKHEVKLPAKEERYNIFSTLNRPPPSTEPVKKKFEIYHSGRSVKQIASFFEGHQKKTNQNIPSDVQLQREAFQVLGDLDQKLAKEQSCSHPPRTNIASTYQYGNIYSKESLCRNPSDIRKEYSTLSSRDERRTVSLGDAHSTHAIYQPRRFSEMYSVRHHSESKTESCSKDIYARSLCSDLGSKSPSFAPISGKFSSSSLHLPSESLEHERSRPHKPRRIPVTSIRWNTSASSQPEVSGRPFRTQSALDLTYASNTSQQNRIFDLYKYGNSNKVSPSGSNDFHKVNYQNNVKCRTSENSSNTYSTGYYKTDSCGLKSISKFPTQTNSHWEEENKENSLKFNKVTSQPPSYAGSKSDKYTEHMEALIEYPSQDNICNIMDQAEDCIFSGNKSDPHNLNLQTKNMSAKSDNSGVDLVPCRENLDVGHQNIPVACTMTHEIGNKTEETVKISPSGLSELEPMEVYDPKASFPYADKLLAISKDMRKVGNRDQKDTSLTVLKKHSSSTRPLFANQDRATFAFQSSEDSVQPNILNKDYSPSTNVFTASKPIGWSNTVSGNTSTDDTERLVMLNSRQSSKNNQLEGYRSDMLKHQKKNASSLPDLFDQKNCYTDFSFPTNKNEEKRIDSSLTTVSTTVSAKTHKMSPGKYFSSHITSQGEDSSSRMVDSLKGIKTCSFDAVFDRTSKEEEHNTPLLEKVSSSAEPVTEPDGTNKVLDLPETASSSFDIHKRYRSMHFNNDPNYAQHGADTNNNNRLFPKTLQTHKVFSEANRSISVFTDPKRGSYNRETHKIPEYEMFPKSQIFVKDILETETNQQNVGSGTLNVETEKGNTQNVFNHLNQQGTGNITEINEQPKIQSITVLPTSQIVEEHLQRKSCTTKDETEKKTLNLLKEHLLLTPKPYKKSVNTKEDTNPPFSGGGLTPNMNTCESLSDDVRSFGTNSISEIQQKSKTYSCQGVTERTQIYETCYTDSSKPDLNTVEYHKVVSIYYTLPRNYYKRQSNVSQNNLKNIDQTIQNSRAPSALLETMINKCSEAEENHGLTYQNIGKPSPSYCAPKNELTKELDSGEMPLGRQHLLNFNLIPLQTDLLNKNNRPLPDAETTSTDFDLVDQFSSLHMSEIGFGQRHNDLQKQRSSENINEYSPTRTSPQYTQNNYYTLPNRKSNLQDLDKSILENDIATARNRYNLYSKRGKSFPTTPESQDVFFSPTFGYDYFNFTGSGNSANVQERQLNDTHHFLKKDGLCNKDPSGDGVIYREDIPSIYKSKSIKDLNRSESHHTRDKSPGMETKLSPQSHSHPYDAKVNEPLNRTRPSYNSKFVQKKMKPINAKKFTFSFDNNGQKEYNNSQSSESFGESLRPSDIDSPSVLYSPKDSFPSHVNKHYYGQRSSAECGSSQPSNMYRSRSLKSINHDYQEEEVEIRRKSDGYFSSKSYGGNMKGRSHSGINSGDVTHNRSYSTEMIDENDNWPYNSMGSAQTPVYTAKAVDYGIFGKEQQEALLNNVKRSLTEGRLWRPSFLKNPNSLRNEEHYTSHQTGCKPDDSLKGTLNIYEGEVPHNSESDNDTTTDDEYYLNENDKESEL